MTCCSNPGEILVLPRGIPPGQSATHVTGSHGPLPGDIVSSWDELFLTTPQDVPPHARERNHQLRSRPYVALVPEDEVDVELARLRQHPEVITATRNWSVSLASPVEGLQG